MVRVGIVGIGFMGWIHWLAYRRASGIEVRGIATRDPVKRTGDWRGIKGNFGPAGEKVDLSEIRVYETVEQLAADPEIDVVDICLPPHAHEEAALAALAAGKHVFCEKPLAVSLEACDRLVEAARRADRQLVVGHVLPFFPEFAEVRRTVENGSLGRPTGGRFHRIISDPTWLSDFYDAERVGGPVVDLHVHDAHFIRTLFGMPRTVDAVGRMRGEVVEYFEAIYRFDDPGLVVTAGGGVILSQARPFTHGFEIRFEQGTMQFDFAAYVDQPETMPLKVLRNDGSIVRPEFPGADSLDGFIAEVHELRDAVTSGRASELLGGAAARDAIAIGNAVTRSVREGKPVAIG